MEYQTITSEIWKTGRARGMSNKDIRANWFALWHEVQPQVYQYNEQIEEEAKSGIYAIFDEIESTIHTYTKSPVTERAELTSLDNIKMVIAAAVDQAGAVPTFNAFAKLYDSGSGEWIQRIVTAIYDQELAEWASGMPAYIARLQSEIVAKMSELTGENINTNNIDFKGISEMDIDEGYETDEGFYLDTADLKAAWDAGLS